MIKRVCIFIISFLLMIPSYQNEAEALCFDGISCGNYVLIIQLLNSQIPFVRMQFPSGYRDCDNGEISCIKDRDPVWGVQLEANHEPLYFPQETDSIKFKLLGVEVSTKIGECTPLGIPNVMSVNVCTRESNDKICGYISQSDLRDEFTKAAGELQEYGEETADKAGIDAPSTFNVASFDSNQIQLGCFYKGPQPEVGPLCVDPITMQRTYGFYGGQFDQPIFDSADAYRSGPDICSPYIGTTCFTWWKYFKDLPASKFNGHPFKMYVTGSGAEDDPYNLYGSEFTGEFINSRAHIAGPIMDCMLSTIKNIFYYRDSYTANSYFPKGKLRINIVQDALRTYVMAALVLYVILWASRVMLTPQPPQKADIFIHIMKMMIVIYLGLGPFMEQYFRIIIDSAVSLSSIVARAGMVGEYGSICNQLQLVGNGDLPFERGIALWDYFDCKLYSYLGYGQFKGAMVFMIMASSIFSFPLGFFLFLLITYVIIKIFGVFLQFMKIFILSMISITMIVFLTPVIAPFLLFKFGGLSEAFTKWMNMIIQLSFYPMIIAAFMAILVACIDTVMYGSTVVPDTGWINPDNCDDKAFMCIITKIISNEDFGSLSIPLLGKIPILMYNHGFFDLFKATLWMIIFLYLFSVLLGELMSMAAQITGGIQLDFSRIAGGNPAAQLFDKALNKGSNKLEYLAAKGLGVDKKTMDKKTKERDSVKKDYQEKIVNKSGGIKGK